MPRLYLGLVLHNHQPVGNYGFVIRDIYEHAYEPMLAALERHPGVRAAVHNSGPLWDWIRDNQPSYVERMRALCARGQVEVVGGGYYEPVLPMITDRDKAGQIAKMRRFIEERFGQTPAGLWLTERVWEPGLPAPLADAGVRWTLVDDAHFRMAGMTDDQLAGYWITEDQGKRVALFAGSQRLRYTVPWLNVEDLIAELHGIADANTHDAPYLVLGDDGEKFGGWPTTHAHVWEGGWIERFFSALESEADWIETITPGAYMVRYPARGLTYLPAASYAEMMEWAMPAGTSSRYHRTVTRLEEQRDANADVLAFVRGGFWRYFLAKYPEANTMHKRALRIDARLAAHEDADAREALWAAQCNCPYWHGVFGGLYLRHIRAAANANLVRAERLADAGSGAGMSVREEDFDFDGRAEVLVQTPDVSLLLHPAAGGMISELDMRQRDYAALDVVARRREAYHDALIEGTAGGATEDLTNIHGGVRLKDQDLDARLVFDRYRRAGLQEWIVATGTSVESFARGEAEVLFEPDGAWAYEIARDGKGVTVTLRREHAGWRIEKRITVPTHGESIDVRYSCENTSREPRHSLLVSEWNVSAPQAAGGDDRIARLLADNQEIDIARETTELADVHVAVVTGSAPWGLRCDLDGAEMWAFPVETVSSSEGGLERTPQGASVSVVREVGGEPAKFGFRFSVEALSS